MLARLRPKICQDCGAMFLGGPHARYCPVCRKGRRRTQSQAAKVRALAGLSRPLGSTDRCAFCGGDYVVTGPKQKYCPTCAPEATKAANREPGPAEAQAGDISPPPKTGQRKGPRPCAICGELYEAPNCRLTCDKPECRNVLRRLYQSRAAVASRRRGRLNED